MDESWVLEGRDKPYFRYVGDRLEMPDRGELPCARCGRFVKSGETMYLARVPHWLLPEIDEWVCEGCVEDVSLEPILPYLEAQEDFAREIAHAFDYADAEKKGKEQEDRPDDLAPVAFFVTARVRTVEGKIYEVRWGPDGALLGVGPV
jgi:hypothetical protein